MKKILLTLFVFALSATYAFSQCTTRPIINNFSPNTGFIGSTVTITGANFDATTITNNKVFFGATEAIVQSANFGQLVVTVPVGATTARIAVTNQCNLTAYSSVPFNGIFCPTPLSSSTYQNTSFNLTGIYGAYNMLAVDMDLDGRPEVVSSTNGGNLTIAQNNSTPGNLNFSAHNYAGKGGQAIYTADLDGDGRQDLISTYNSFLNTSTGAGNIAIGNAISNQSVSSYQSAAGDFNNDGKIDIVGETGNVVYVARNLSTGIGNVSFSARQSAGNIGGRATGLQTADIDGDGKIDIIGTQRGNHRAFTLRNTTPDGATTFTFETVEYWSVGGTEPYRCQIADFNKDGKIDLTTCNYFGTYNTAVLTNVSTPGDIDMSVLINLPSFNNNYRIQVGDVDGDGFPDIVTKSLGFNLFAVYKNTTPFAGGTTSFAARIDYSSSAQAEVSGIVIGDLDGDFVPDIATSGISSNQIRFHRNTSSQQDNTPPTAICKNINVGLSPTGTVVVDPSQVDNGSSDACGIDNITLSQTTFTCADIGDNNVTLTVTDLAGNTSTCSAIINVQPAAIIVAGQTTVCSGQTIPLTANPGDSYQWKQDGVTIAGATSQNYTASVTGDYTVVVTNAGGCSGESVATSLTISAGSNVTISPASASITCGSPTTLSAGNAATYQWQLNGANIPGATIQTYSATQAGDYTVNVIDIFGCQGTSAIVTLAVGPPVASAVDANVYLDINGNVSITAADIDNGTAANCPNGTITINPSSFTCADIGANTVSLIVNDGNGNSDTATATVTVFDTLAPTTILQTGTVYLDANGQATVTAADVDNGSSDACGISTFTVSPAIFDCSNLGQGSSSNEVPLNYIGSRNINHRSYGGMYNPHVDEFWFPQWSGNQVYKTDPISGANLGTFNFPTNPNMQLWMDESSTDIYTANWGSRTIRRYNGNTLVWSHDIGTTAANVTTDANYVYTIPYNGTTIRVIDKATGAFVADYNMPGRIFMYGGLVHSNGKLYAFGVGYFGSVQNTWNAVHIFDASNGAYLSSQSLPYPTYYGVSFDGEVVWVGNGSRIEGYQIASGSSFGAGSGATNVVAFTATDVNGNVAYDTTSVNVVDTLSPNVQATNTTVYLDASGNASITLGDINGSATDNCEIKDVYLSGNTNYNCSSIGANIVHVVATDSSSNIDSASATITVVDNIAPTMAAQNITVNLNASLTVNITAADIDNGSFDNCTLASLTLSQSTFDCDDKGQIITVTLTGTDQSGNSNSTTAQVTVLDPASNCNQPPVAVCQNITIYTGANCDASIVAADVDGGSTDPDGDALTYTVDQNGPFGVGTHTVNLTVSDGEYTDVCSATVTVVDNTAPTALCQDVTVILDSDGNASVTAAQVDNGSSDACGIASLSVSPATFDCSNTGANAVTLTVTDNNGNSSSCQATVTVVDNEAPVIVGNNNNITMNFDAGSGAPVSYTEAGITFLSLYGTSSHVHLGDNNGDGSNDIRNHANCCSTPYRLTVGAGTEFTLISMEVKSVSGNPTFSVHPSGPSVTITSTGTFTFPASFANATEVRWHQASGNMVIDNVIVSTATTGSCPADVVVSTDAGSCGAVVNYASTAEDNCSASIAFSPASGSFFNLGTTTVTTTATDASGNTSSCTFDVTVNDDEAPAAICQNATVVLDASGNGSITTADIDNGSNDACGIASLALSKTAFNCSDVGANTVTLTVTDNNGNVSNCSATVTVIDNVNPITLTQNITVQLDASGNGSITTTDIDNGSNDACGIASLALDNTSFTCADVGANTVTLTATDVNGNSSSATATVTVEDNVNPITLAQNVTVQLDANGNGSITTTDIDNGSNDACGIASLALDNTSFSCADVGANTVTLTATDVNGNSSSATAIVTVEDNVNPITLTQNVTLQLDANGNGSITTTDIDNGSNDACGIASLALDNTSFTCANVGANTVTLTSTDVNGNSSSATATVIVVDNVNPVTLTQNVTVQLDANGNGSITTTDIDNGSNDACGIASLALDNTSFTCADVGANTVTLTATDVNGNSSSATATVTVEDNVNPIAICQDVTVTLSNGAASITPQMIDNGSNDACGIANLNVDTDNWDCNDIGTHPVVLTVTDNNGNSSTCNANVTVVGVIPSCTITSVPSSNVYTGANVNTIFLGYGAQSTVLDVNATGGSSFTYAWTGQNLSSTTSANPTFTPTQAGNYTFDVTVTNNFGCVTTCSITICVRDIRVRKKNGSIQNGKVYLCHVPPGKPNKTLTLSISVNAVASHLSNHSGDALGICGTSCNDNNNRRKETSIVDADEFYHNHDHEVNLYPNPTNGMFNLEFDGEFDEVLTIEIRSMRGQIIKTEQINGMDMQSKVQLDISNQANGIYFVSIKGNEYLKVIKFTKM